MDVKRGNLYLIGFAISGIANLSADPVFAEVLFKDQNGNVMVSINSAGWLQARGSITDAQATTERQSLYDQYVTYGLVAHGVAPYKFVDANSYVDPLEGTPSFSFSDLQCHHGALSNAHGTWQ